MAKTPGGGLQHIRDAVTARSNQMVIIARNIGTSVDLLDSFARGNCDLPAEVLQALVREIWQHIEYNAEADALEPVQQPEARSLGIRPTWKIDIPKITPGPAQRGGPQPLDPAPPKPKRAGWIGGWE